MSNNPKEVPQPDPPPAQPTPSQDPEETPAPNEEMPIQTPETEVDAPKA